MKVNEPKLTQQNNNNSNYTSDTYLGMSNTISRNALKAAASCNAMPRVGNPMASITEVSPRKSK